MLTKNKRERVKFIWGKATNKSLQADINRNGHIACSALKTQPSNITGDIIMAVCIKHSAKTAINTVRIRLVIILFFIYSKYSNRGKAFQISFFVVIYHKLAID